MNSHALDCSRCKRLAITLRSQIEKNEELQAMLKNMVTQLELGTKEAKDALINMGEEEKKNENLSLLSNAPGNDVVPDEQSTVVTAPTQQSDTTTVITPATANSTVDIPLNSINGSSVVAASTPYNVANANTATRKPPRSIIRGETPVPKPRSTGVSFDNEITKRLNQENPPPSRNRRAGFHIPSKSMVRQTGDETINKTGPSESQIEPSIETPKTALERRPKYMSGNSDDGCLDDLTNRGAKDKTRRLTSDSEVLVLPKRKARPAVQQPMITKRKTQKTDTTPDASSTIRPKRNAAPKSLKEPALNKKMRRGD